MAIERQLKQNLHKSLLELKGEDELSIKGEGEGGGGRVLNSNKSRTSKPTEKLDLY